MFCKEEAVPLLFLRWRIVCDLLFIFHYFSNFKPLLFSDFSCSLLLNCFAYLSILLVWQRNLSFSKATRTIGGQFSIETGERTKEVRPIRDDESGTKFASHADDSSIDTLSDQHLRRVITFGNTSKIPQEALQVLNISIAFQLLNFFFQLNFWSIIFFYSISGLAFVAFAFMFVCITENEKEFSFIRNRLRITILIQKSERVSWMDQRKKKKLKRELEFFADSWSRLIENAMWDFFSGPIIDALIWIGKRFCSSLIIYVFWEFRFFLSGLKGMIGMCGIVRRVRKLELI